MPPDEAKIPIPPPAATTAVSTSTPLDEFSRLEEKFNVAPDLNHKFDLWLDWLRSVSNEEKIFFTQNLGVMQTSGLSLARALRTLTLQTTNAKFKRILFRITRQVEKGITLADAMAPYPKIFPPIFVSMVRAGEASGQMEQVLTELTRQLKRSHSLQQKVRGALMYPMAILIAMVGIGAAMIIFVIPKLLVVFKEMNVQLPLPTRLLIGLSDFVNNYILFVAPAVALIAVGLIYSGKTADGKKFWHFLALKLPIINKIIIKINLAKISRTLGSLLTTDIPIVGSLQLSAEVIGNVYYRASLLDMAGQVEKGKTISSLMPGYRSLYPPVVEQMIAVGEETGEISKILSQLADFYEEDVSQTMDSLPSIIEPVLIVLLGGAVGAMAVAIILPMFTLSQAV